MCMNVKVSDQSNRAIEWGNERRGEIWSGPNGGEDPGAPQRNPLPPGGNVFCVLVGVGCADGRRQKHLQPAASESGEEAVRGREQPHPEHQSGVCGHWPGQGLAEGDRRCHQQEQGHSGQDRRGAGGAHRRGNARRSLPSFRDVSPSAGRQAALAEKVLPRPIVRSLLGHRQPGQKSQSEAPKDQEWKWVISKQEKVTAVLCC